MSTLSKFECIKQQLREEIKRSYRPGDKIPGQRAIMERFGASLSTVDRALRELVGDGVLTRRHGSGTYVTDQEGEPTHNYTIAVILMRNVGLTPCFFYFPTLMALTADLSRCGYSFSYFYVEELESRRSLLAQLGPERFAGFILIGDTDDVWTEELKMRQVPFVVVDHVPGVAQVTYITSDHEGGVAQGVEYLVACGHRRIGFVSDSMHSNLMTRYEGFCMAMAEQGLPVRRHHVIRHWFEPQVLEDLRRMFAASDAPTAFLGSNDYSAGILIAALRRIGLEVPRDISVIGFDAEPVNEVVPPGLTSLAVDREEFGRLASKTIQQRIAGEEVAPIILPVRLMIKSSVREIPNP